MAGGLVAAVSQTVGAVATSHLEQLQERLFSAAGLAKDEVQLVGMPRQPFGQQNSRPETQQPAQLQVATHRINTFAKNIYFKDLPQTNTEIAFSMQINISLLAPSS